MTIMLNGRARMRFSGSPLEQFAGTLGNQLGKPVWDAAGLKGKCDFSVYWTSEGGRIPPLPPPPGVVAPPVASSPDESGPNVLNKIREGLSFYTALSPLCQIMHPYEHGAHFTIQPQMVA
ncbi:hypothetical protein SBA4_6520006 [Candidatus Sulfopaludibacter sp. SbA4]|nr:hypothetical protein SBA4_6520006 [Candidatus Sulfopaludibacter sp. SbA4]